MMIMMLELFQVADARRLQMKSYSRVRDFPPSRYTFTYNADASNEEQSVVVRGSHAVEVHARWFAGCGVRRQR
jgi:hypothetical protein